MFTGLPVNFHQTQFPVLYPNMITTVGMMNGGLIYAATYLRKTVFLVQKQA